MSDEHVLRMPIKRFWLFSTSVDRMNAMSDLRAIQVAVSVLSGESYKTVTQHLSVAAGAIAVKSFEKDEDGISKLRDMILGF